MAFTICICNMYMWIWVMAISTTTCVIMRSLFEVFWEFFVPRFCAYKMQCLFEKWFLYIIACCVLIFMCNLMCNYHDHFLYLLIFFMYSTWFYISLHTCVQAHLFSHTFFRCCNLEMFVIKSLLFYISSATNH